MRLPSALFRSAHLYSPTSSEMLHKLLAWKRPALQCSPLRHSGACGPLLSRITLNSSPSLDRRPTHSFLRWIPERASRRRNRWHLFRVNGGSEVDGRGRSGACQPSPPPPASDRSVFKPFSHAQRFPVESGRRAPRLETRHSLLTFWSSISREMKG